MRARLSVERLEDRTVPTTFLITNTLGDGTVGSLAWAINQVNADSTDTAAQPDVINFNITAASDAAAGGMGFIASTGVATITPQGGLPTIGNPVVINGYTQPGASQNTLAQGDDAVLKVQLDLSAVSTAYNVGLRVNANNTTISGLVVNNLPTTDTAAIYLTGTGDQVTGNFIGTDVTGSSIVGGSVVTTGVFYADAPSGIVGGTTPAARNVIAGFTFGVGDVSPDFPGLGRVVEGNYIGTNASGTAALGNVIGVSVEGLIGGTAPGAGNLISGNQIGVNIGAGNASQTVVQGNLIGTDASGTSALGNTQEGIFLYDVSGANADSALIGGTTAAAGNVISGNSIGIDAGVNGAGVLIEGNYIGTDITGTKPLGNVAAGIYTASGMTIGGTAPGAGNVISGNVPTPGFNVVAGIRIFGNNSQIEGNLIGTDYTGTNPLPNGYGILSQDGGSNNVIGGTQPGAGNTIAFNGSPVQISTGAGNSILSNSIYGNGGGIGLLSGGNNNQAAPVVQTVASSPTGLTVSGTVPGATGTYLVQVFANASSDANQGQTLLGSLTTDASGNFTGNVAAVPGNEPYVTATATVQNSGGTYGSTSQFSQFVVPTASARGPYTMVYGGSLTLSGDGNDPDGDYLTYSWTINGHAGAATGRNVILSWTQLQALGVNSLQPFNVSVTVSDGNGSTATSATVQVTVTKGTPTFSQLSAATVTVGTGNATISGMLSDGALIPTGNVSIQVGSVTPVAAAINPDGTFSASVPVSSLAAGAYTVTFSYAGDGNFNGASASATLDLTYGVTLLSNLSHAQPSGSSFTSQVEPTDASGNNLSATPSSVTAVGFAPASNPTQITPVTDSGAFSLASNRKSWSYILKTPKTLASGTYVFYFTIQGDPVTHSLTFQVK
jgi:hypothetical protein